MADPKSYLDPDARRGQPHSQFWYQLSINDPEGLRAMEDMVIAQHQKPITTLGHHEEHHDEEPPDVVSATAQGAIVGFFPGVFWGMCNLAWNPDMMTMTKKGPILSMPTAAFVTRGMFVPGMYLSSIGATYLGVRALAHNARGTCDIWNSVYGGFAAGLVMGSVTKRMDKSFATGLGIALVGGVGDFYRRNSGSLFAWDKEDALQRHWGVRPYQHRESDDLRGLKEKYPEHRNL